MPLDLASIFPGDSASARRCREHHWAGTPLGDPAGWPMSLVTLVRTVLGAHHPMLLTWGPEFTQLFNDAFLPLIGGGPRLEASLGADARQFWGDTWQAAMPSIEAVLRGGAPVITEDAPMPLDRDGRRDEAFITYSVSPALDDAGAQAGLLILAQETTARVHMERAHRDADRKIRDQAALLDLASDCIIVHDMTGTVRYWNAGAERIFGYSAADVLGGSAATVNYEDAQVVAGAVERTIANGSWAGELPLHRRDGTPLVLDSRWNVERDADGVPHRVLCIGTDVTERKQLLQQFLRAQRMESIGALAGGIAHDLNNVLSPILLSLELLRAELPGASEQELLEMLRTSAERGAGMVKQILAFARGVEGEHHPVNIRHVVRDVQRIIRETFPRTIHVVDRTPNLLWTVRGNPTQFHQVLMNLAVNARDAMPEGGTITIDAANVDVDEQYAGMAHDASPGRYVRLTISDEGEGMSPEVLARIYEPFFTTKPVGQGTGLGIPTTLGIVKAHGGFMSIYSEVGKGSVFRLYFPATADSAPVEETPTAALPRGNGETVLLIDDDGAVRTLVAATLEAFGYSVLSAPDGAEGVEVFRRHRGTVALVITDITMPVMDGPATMRAIRAIDPDVSFIVISGLADVQTRHVPRNLPVAKILAKPFTAAALLQAVQEHVRDVWRTA